MEFSAGKYTIQGIDITHIARQFGTPLYVYDADKIAEQIGTLKKTFGNSPLKIKYAAKALTNISILKLMRKQGIGVEVVSIQEAHLALKAGFTAAEIMFTPSGVDFEEIKEGIRLELGINLDNLSVLEKFGAEYGGTYPCGLRLNPHIMAGGNLKISTGHIHSKFGISIEQMDKIQALVEKYNIRIIGLHIHTGSDIMDADVFLKIAGVLFNAAKNFNSLRFLDFGSGYKVAYKEGDKVTDMDTLGRKLSEAFNQFAKEYGKPLELWIEPGKFIVSECGIFLVKVNVIKQTPALTFAGVNSGLNHLLRPMMYDAYHEIINISNPDGPARQYNVVGYICETDTFGADRTLAEVREGDILAMKNAGAYGFSMASNYNSRLRPAEVLVVNGEARLIREQEKFEDLLKGQVIIDL